MSHERGNQTLELIGQSPTPYRFVHLLNSLIYVQKSSFTAHKPGS